MKAKLSESLFKGYRKPKKPGLTKRNSGYYVVKYPGERKMSIAEYVPKDKCWYFTGVIFRYYDYELSYISPAPIKIPKPRKK